MEKNNFEKIMAIGVGVARSARLEPPGIPPAFQLVIRTGKVQVSPLWKFKL